MKIQNLAVIFIIIVLPISILLSSYTKNQIKTIQLQSSYDSKLQNATYDAVKAFQLNSANSDSSDLANSKLRDIEASANTFFNSMASNFKLDGYNREVLKEYVPALVYTMYDGMYIYSPYVNTLDEKTKEASASDATFKDGEQIYGAKPYINYSCRYKLDGADFVITYSLDNYIVIQGKDRNGDPIYETGYLLTDVKEEGSEYRGVSIPEKEDIKQYIYDLDVSEVKEYSTRKLNGAKFYQNDDKQIFSIFGNKKVVQNNFGDSIKVKENDNARQYYEKAYNLKTRLKDLGLEELKTSNAVDENGEKYGAYGDYKIFEGLNDTTNDIEEPNSNFNQHRLAVIRNTIEKNLSVAISNYNSYASGSSNFQMPKLKEDDWDKLLNNISVISYLQGLSIGRKNI